MTDLDMWSLLVGVLLPALVAMVNRVQWPSWVKGLVTVASSVVAGGVTAYLTGQLSGGTCVHAGLVVAVAALGSWRLFWHPTGIGPAIERAINPGTPPAEAPVNVATGMNTPNEARAMADLPPAPPA